MAKYQPSEKVGILAVSWSSRLVGISIVVVILTLLSSSCRLFGGLDVEPNDVLIIVITSSRDSVSLAKDAKNLQIQYAENGNKKILSDVDIHVVGSKVTITPRSIIDLIVGKTINTYTLVLKGQSLLKMDIVASGLTSKGNYQILEFRANGQAIQRSTDEKYYISINNF